MEDPGPPALGDGLAALLEVTGTPGASQSDEPLGVVRLQLRRHPVILFGKGVVVFGQSKVANRQAAQEPLANLIRRLALTNRSYRFTR